MLSEDIIKIDAAVREKFTYLADGPVDTWRSHLDEVMKGKSWKGDCDDLTSTTLDDLAEYSVPLTSLYRFLVSSTGDDTIDHMVGCVIDSLNNWWIVGDTFGACYPAAQCLHKILRYNQLSERDTQGAIWREGAPFT